MAIMMHNGLAVRTVGEPFNVTTLGELNATTMQHIEYIKAKTVITVPLAELTDVPIWLIVAGSIVS